MPSEQYQRHRDRVAADQREMAANGRDIGKPPKPKNKRRRDRCERDLRAFLETYFPEVFTFGWSPDHLEFLASVQARILTGGRHAIAMPRGSGKTSVLVRAALWALLYGHRSFLALIAAEGEAGEELADQIRIEIETNTGLGEDFPEVCFPVRALEGINQRANAQTSNGKRTHLRWKGRTLIFPTVDGSKASGAIVRVAGITGRIRGMSVTTASGENRRPNLVLIDDFQTDDSARSIPQRATREKIISGAVLGLAGPGKKTAAFASCTVIEEGDSADRILNKVLHPRWRGQRCRLVYDWPTDPAAVAHWEKYLELRAAELADGDELHPKATEYYRKNRKAMDKGGRVGWEDRKLPHELSALQHAYGLRDDNPDTFDAEYQNAPRKTDKAATKGVRLVTSDELVLRTSEYSRGQLPEWAQWITAGVDVQQSTLWWTIAAVGEDFRGVVMDYGVWPEQSARGYFTLADVKKTYARALEIDDHGTALQAALDALTADLFARRFNAADGESARIDRCLIDAGNWTEDVYEFCTGTDLAVLPSHGVGVTAKQLPWSSEKRKRGERRGFGWKMPKIRGTNLARHVNLDSNTWKTALNRAWLAPKNGAAAWSLFKAPPLAHRMFADNLTAEYATETSGRGRKLMEWAARPGRDNHYLDATYLAAAAGVMLGASPPAVVAGNVAKSKAPAKRTAASEPTASEPKRKRSAGGVDDTGGGGSKRRRVSLAELRAEKGSEPARKAAAKPRKRSIKEMQAEARARRDK
jgi:hypothetical protein